MKPSFLQNFLTSGLQFEESERELELNYFFFNSILFINVIIVTVGSVIRFINTEYLHAGFDLGFCFASIILILLARRGKHFYFPISYAVLIISFILASSIYILNPNSIIGTSWFLVILMASFYFLASLERTVTFIASIGIITWVGLSTDRTFGEIFLGLLPLASAYFFLRFADSKHHILRSNIEEQKEHFAHHATHDSLTGVYNRYYFFNALNDTILASEKSQTSFQLFFIDIDDFKQINDTFGHMAGDHILKFLAKRIEEELDSRSILARFGGDEFVIISFNNTGTNDKLKPLECLKRTINHPFFYEGKSIALSLSAGIAYYPEDGTTAKELLKQADQTMYHTKLDRRHHT
jgi:diguanylate cyclase (GGDEF)-like protein